MEPWHILRLSISEKRPQGTIIPLHVKDFRLFLAYFFIQDDILGLDHLLYILLGFINRPLLLSLHAIDILLEIICFLIFLILLVLHGGD